MQIPQMLQTGECQSNIPYAERHPIRYMIITWDADIQVTKSFYFTQLLPTRTGLDLGRVQSCNIILQFECKKLIPNTHCHLDDRENIATYLSPHLVTQRRPHIIDQTVTAWVNINGLFTHEDRSTFTII